MIYNVGSTGASTADKVKYDGAESGLSAETVQAAIDEVQENVESLIITRNVSISGSVSTGGNAKNITIPTVDGYTPVAVAGWYLTGTGASATIIPNMYISGQTLYTYMRSISGTVTLTSASYITILYLKN